MPLTTNFNVPPYFDDYDPNNKYYRILFKPATAVQTRELNQIQSQIQYQIEQLGNALLNKNGTIVDGCSVNQAYRVDYVRIRNFYSNNASLTLSNIANSIVESSTSGLRANILAYTAGNESLYPYTNILYISYINTGNNGVTNFSPNELLNLYIPPRSNNYLSASVYTYNNTSPATYTTGTTTALTISPGTIYQKGYFTKTDFQFVPVIIPTANQFNFPVEQVVGFTTTESIVTSSSDTTLLDNAQGYYNYNAPGADRLKLTSTAVSVDPTTAANSQNFFAVAKYTNGAIYSVSSTSYSKSLGQVFAKYSLETNGNFAVQNFPISIVNSYTNTQNIQVEVGPGRGYVQGYPVSYLANRYLFTRRGTDTTTTRNATTQTSYGNYVLVKEYVGNIDFNTFNTVKIYDTAQQAITNRTFLSSVSGSQIGTAAVRAVEYSNGTPGSKDGTYRVYLFNILMNSGYSFNNAAKSLVFGTSSGIADIVLDVGSANNVTTYDKAIDQTISNLGAQALSTLRVIGSNNATYTAKVGQTATVNQNGTISLPISSLAAKGANNQPYSVNPSDYIIILNGSSYLSNGAVGFLPGTVSISSTNTNVIGTSTSFTKTFSPGEYIYVNATDVRRVVSVSNDTVLTVDTSFTATSGSNTFTKYFPNGYIVPMYSGLSTTRTITSSSGGSPTISINIGSNIPLGTNVYTLNSTLPSTVYYPVKRTNAVQATKNLNKNLLVKINLNTNPGGKFGPWSLGVPDVDNIVGIYANSTTYSNTGTNLINFNTFYFDKNAKDNMYDISKLFLRTGSSLDVTKPYITVQFDAFIPDNSTGVGFFSVDSYTANSTSTNGTAPVDLKDVPIHISPAGTFKLRDSVDFRPFKTATANVTLTLASATIDPAANSSTFNVDSTGGSLAYYPKETEFFTSDITSYLGRKDLVYINAAGGITTVEGSPDISPVSYAFPVDSLPLGVVNIQPYPSLTYAELATLQGKNSIAASIYKDTSYYNSIDYITLKRYTMGDIGRLDNRISNLEYYVSLTLLETQAASLQIIDPATGLNRYKNGIFVEAFTTVGNSSDVSNPDWSASIDLKNNVCRPIVYSEDVDLTPLTLTNTVINSTGITLPYSSVNFNNMQQPYANYYRNLGNVNYSWKSGRIELYPSYSNVIDILVNPAINLSGNYSNTNLLNAAVPIRNLLAVGNEAVDEQVIKSTATLNPSQPQTKYVQNYYKVNYQIAPYMKTREIAFKATNLRPGANLKLYINYNDASAYTAPGTPNTQIKDTSNSSIVYRTDAYGTPLRVSSGGSGANLDPVITSTTVSSITVSTGGVNYVNNSLIVFNSNAPGNGAVAYIRTNSSGTILTANVVNTGIGYDSTNKPSISVAGSIVYGKVAIPAATYPIGVLTFLITDGTLQSNNIITNETTRATGVFTSTEYNVVESYNHPAASGSGTGSGDSASSNAGERGGGHDDHGALSASSGQSGSFGFRTDTGSSTSSCGLASSEGAGFGSQGIGGLGGNMGLGDLY